MPIFVNTRSIHGTPTGVQIYLKEILKHIGSELKVVDPGNITGSLGHLWEQCILPIKVSNNFLWSPSNTGPLLIKRQVVTVHDTSVFDFPQGLNQNFVNYYKFIIGNLAKSCHIITVSNHSKKKIVQNLNIKPENITVIYNGIDPNIFHINKLKDEIDINMKFSCDHYFITTLSSFAPHKNLNNILDAWIAARTKFPSNVRVKLLIVGKNSRDHIFNQTHPIEAEDVIYLGNKNQIEIARLFRSAVGMIYATKFDSFGLPALEAAACGIPVICGNTTAVPEILHNACYSVDPYSVNDISKTIEKVFYDTESNFAIIQNGIKICRNTSWQSTAKNTLSTLNKILS